MAMWLYQLSNKYWSLNNYRLDIWEGERWEWEVRKVAGQETPQPGDSVVFFYAKDACPEPGFYGWAVILRWNVEKIGGEERRHLYFRPVPPSDQLKLRPWGDKHALDLADQVRGKVKLGNVWPVLPDLAASIGLGISNWVGGRANNHASPGAIKGSIHAT